MALQPVRFRAILITAVASTWLACGGAAGRQPEDDPLAFTRLPDLRTLPSLQLGPETTDAALAHLDGLHNLRALGLEGANITNEGLRRLSGLVQLEQLSLSRTRVGDAGLEYLKPLANLKRLRLAGTSVTGLGLRALKHFQKLEVLDLGSLTYIYDADLAHLKDLTALRQLDLGCITLSGPGLEYLHSLRKLERLALPKDRFDNSAVTRLRRALPQVTIAQQAGGGRWGYVGLVGSPAFAGGVWDPFWTGDYRRFAQVLSHVNDATHNWETKVWLGHTHWLQGDRRRAVETYREALGQLEKEVAARASEGTRNLLARAEPGWDWSHFERWPLVRFLAEAEMYELSDPKAAIRTLSRSAGRQPDISRIDPIAREKMLAEAYEQDNDPVNTMECCLRLRFATLADPLLPDVPLLADAPAAPRPARVSDEYAGRIADLRAKLVGRALPAGASFAMLTENTREARFKPREPQSNSPHIPWLDHDGLNDGADQNDVFVVIAPPGKEFSKLELDLTATEWFNSMSYGYAPSHRPDVWFDPGVKAGHPTKHELEIEQSDAVYLLFSRKENHPGISELTVRAAKWDVEKRTSAQKSPPLAAKGGRVRGPLQETPLELPGFERTGLEDAGLAVQSNGRWLMAFPTPGPSRRRQIMVTSSPDGRRWERPWSFEHNDLFDAAHPWLFVEGQEIWMFYQSNRFDLQALDPKGDGGRHLMWLARTRDGHQWSLPVPIGISGSMHWSDKDGKGAAIRVFRTPDADYAVLDGRCMTRHISPGRLLEEVEITPWRHDGWPMGAPSSSPAGNVAVYDRNGRFHYIAWGGSGDVCYCQPGSRRITELKSPVVLFSADHPIGKLLPLFDGDRMLLLYVTSAGAFVRAGTLQSGGPKLGEATPLSGLSAEMIGRQFVCRNDRVYLAIGGDHPRILEGDLERLSQTLAPRPRQVSD